VVIGHDAPRVNAALTGLPVTFVWNPDFALGQSRALVRGVQALPPEVRAAVIGVGDQPFLTSGIIEQLVDRYQASGAPLAVPRYAGRRGNPVLFDRVLFPELLQVTGDQGGRPVLERHREDIAWLDVADPLPGADLDTVEEYRRLTGE
jgi:molybdenum cofactor cytidylyltransferase